MKKLSWFLVSAIILMVMVNSSYAIIIGSTHRVEVRKKSFTIRISHPVVEEPTVNKLIQQYIEQTVSDFKNNVKQNAKTITNSANLPKISENSNTLRVSYRILNNDKKVFSIRFANDTYFYANAHPMTSFHSINYDLKNKKSLSLNNIFLPNSPYLNKLSQFSTGVLTQKLAKQSHDNTVKPFESGLKPIAQNFQVWNFTPKGLLFTFPPYQVAAYVFGAQEVLVPFTVINKVLDPNYRQ